MDEFSSGPENVESAETPAQQPEGGAEQQPNVVERMTSRVERVEKLSETQKGGGQAKGDDDEDQKKAVKAAKAARRSGRFVHVLDKEVDLNVVGSGFFRSSAKRVSSLIKKDISKASTWLRTLREAYQSWDGGNSRNGKMHIIMLAMVMFWKA